jgi:hypothetical protein
MRRIALIALLLTACFCASTTPGKLYQADAALAAAYKVAAPLRADLCRPPSPHLSSETCATGLKVLQVDYALLQKYTSLLASYQDTKDQSTYSQALALYPNIQKAIVEISALIDGWKK